ERPALRPRSRRRRDHRHRLGGRAPGRAGRGGRRPDRRGPRRGYVSGLGRGRSAGLRSRAGGHVRPAAGAGDGREGRPDDPRHARAVRLGPPAQPWPGRRVPAAGRHAGPGRGEGRPHAVRAGAPRRDRWAAGQHRMAGTEAGGHRLRRGDRRVPDLRPRRRCAVDPGGRGQLRRAGGLPAGHHRRTPLRGRRLALGRQRRSRPGLRPAGRPGAHPAGHRPHRERRRTGHRHGVAGRRRVAGRGQPEGDRPQRARPRGPGAVGTGRPRPGGGRRRAHHRGLERL
ncbi:MAG: Patatin, partial [uncultured Blastococcus sp.]